MAAGVRWDAGLGLWVGRDLPTLELDAETFAAAARSEYQGLSDTRLAFHVAMALAPVAAEATAQSLARSLTGGAARLAGAELDAFLANLQPNPAGTGRSVQDLHRLGAAAGIDTSLMRFQIVDNIGSDLARYGPDVLPDAVSFNTFFQEALDPATGEMAEFVTVRVSRRVLQSDEEIVAMLAHESHEISYLYDRLLGGGLGGGEVSAMQRGWLHDEAWEAARAAVERFRGP